MTRCIHCVHRAVTAQRLLHVSCVDDHGDTPLHIAVRLGDIAMAKALHRAGADAEFPNRQNLTAVNLAIQSRDNQILRALGKLFDSDDAATALQPQHKKKSVGFLPHVEAVSPEPDDSLTDDPYAGRPTAFAVSILNAADDGFCSVGDGRVSDPRVSNCTRNKRMRTEALNDIANDIFLDMQNTIRMDRDSMMTLEGWIDKKQQAPPFGFHTRWCVLLFALRGNYIL